VDQGKFDYLVLVLFGEHGSLESAWGLTHAEVVAHAHSTVTRSGGDVTKLAVRGGWRSEVAELDLRPA
jgi:hypothetical protein